MSEDSWNRCHAQFRAVTAQLRRRLREALRVLATYLRSWVFGRVQRDGPPIEDIWSRARRAREEDVAIRATRWQDVRVWDLAGIRLLQITLDPGQITLLIYSGYLGDPDSMTILIKTSFAIRQNGIDHTVDPCIAESVVPALRLLNNEVASIRATRDGSLSLQFTDGAEVSVMKQPESESWQMLGEGTFDNPDMSPTWHESPPGASDGGEDTSIPV